MVDSCSRENGVLCNVARSWSLFLHDETCYYECKAKENGIKYTCNELKVLDTERTIDTVLSPTTLLSNLEAERWFLEAARDGKPTGSIKAQTVLGLFYSRPGEDSFDLQKVG
ncbi:unnamed protein product [Pocillopora meandrina]|uniref:Uncharacterized protein n=1 Tax=Pocillopora meandrina TaxID=46732 RepID=A0AAU9X8L5_9CNID|nr:unnamed protein product [Pocillopora meandrina]